MTGAPANGAPTNGAPEQNQDLDRIAARLRASGSVWAEEEARLLLDAAAASGDDLDALVSRRVAGERLETVVGWARFLGLRILVRPGVFVPRPRTEFLAETAIALAPESGTVVELCCGSGAIGAALLDARPRIRLIASDLDPVAVEVARLNLPGAEVLVSDLAAGLPSDLEGGVELVVANVPYVPSDRIRTLPRDVRDNEPAWTLDGGADGLAVLRRAVRDAARLLRPGGAWASELDTDQVPDAVRTLEQAGFDPEVLVDDEQEATVLIGRRRAAYPSGAPGWTGAASRV